VSPRRNGARFQKGVSKGQGGGGWRGGGGLGVREREESSLRGELNSLHSEKRKRSFLSCKKRVVVM